MPLRDHFHSPLAEFMPWESIHSAWATHLADALNEKWLSARFLARERARFTDAFEVLVFDQEEGRQLVGAIELVSPGNKDRASERGAFVAKCATYLHEGVSVALIDVVTSRRFNLHNDLARFLGLPEESRLSEETHLYAAAYRPVRREENVEVDIWREACVLGANLPTMPLRLTGDLFVPVEFETAYTETCRRRRIT